jgi:hypothetical protein
LLGILQFWQTVGKRDQERKSIGTKSVYLSFFLIRRILKEAEKRDKAEQLRKEKERGIEERRKKQVIILTTCL